jgi:alkane 1-monooxygenase
MLFLLPFLVPMLVICGYQSGHLWTFRVVAWIYLLGPFLDALAGTDTRSSLPDQGHVGAWRWAPMLWVPAQAAILLCGLAAVQQQGEGWQFTLALAVNVGMAGGMFGVTAAHELLHRPGKVEQQLAAALLTLLHYPHFCIEHVHGHHRKVATPEDPATARLRESFYAFYLRCVSGSLSSAWRIEGKRLRRLGRTAWTTQNRMLRYLASLLLLYLAIGYFFGWLGVAFFVIQGLIALSMLEVINYVGHYGLARRETATGRYEPVMPWHSWNSSDRVTNWLLFNVGRHSNHHCEAGRGYWALRHCADAPQLPAGYFSMFVLALLPPLWRRIMDPRVAAWRQSLVPSECTAR